MNQRMKPSMSVIGISEISKLPAKPLFLSIILEIDDMEKPALYINPLLHVFWAMGIAYMKPSIVSWLLSVLV